MLVLLRLSLGWHFLYEGVWKIEHREEFSAEPFLTQAKGPMAGLFYAMLPDIDGRERLRIETGEKGKKVIHCSALMARWNQIRQQFVDAYRPAGNADEAARQSHARLEKAAQETFDEFRKSTEKYLADNLTEIDQHFKALDRLQQNEERAQDAPFQRKWRWDTMQELRREAAPWIAELQGRENAYKDALLGLLEPKQRERGFPTSWNPLRWTRMEQINFAVTYGLAVIGLFLMLGLFTRLAALGGAAFMAFVVMSTWPWPGTYPPDPLVLGHTMFVNKDFIEMIALLTVAAARVGRWGGLDCLLHGLLCGSCCSERSPRGKEEENL